MASICIFLYHLNHLLPLNVIKNYWMINYFAVHLKHCKSTILQFFLNVLEKQQEACNGEKNYWMFYFRTSSSIQNYDFKFHTSNKIPVCKFHQFMVFHFASMSLFIGEGNGNPLQYSCLENPMDKGAWWATVHRVAESWTRLKWLSTIYLALCE